MNNITKYIHTILLTGMVGVLSGCNGFLDETPYKSGSAYIYHMDQLKELSGSPDLYMLQSASYYTLDPGTIESYMLEQNFFNDAIDVSPEYLVYGTYNSYPYYKLYAMDKEFWTTDQSVVSYTWTPSWNRIFTFNTILENVDKVEQTSQQTHDQVAGEAYFGRAYYHFILMQQYCLWNESAPGIGYREGTAPGEVPARETVGYTLGKIYDDLAKSEELLTKAGRTHFDQKTNFRPTVPTVKALRARIDLYRGKYDSALENANAALAAHNTLVSFKDDPLYELVPYCEYRLLNENNTGITEKLEIKAPSNLWTMILQPVTKYDELYINGVTNGIGDICPISERQYNLFDRENDARWIYFYSSSNALVNAVGLSSTVELDGIPTPDCIIYENQKWLKPWMYYCYYRFTCSWGRSPAKLLGMTTAEMMLIKAECLARSGKTAEAAQVLKDLRATRFMNIEAANNIGGSVQDVLDERDRELANLWRFYDIKRLNGAEKAGISITREILTDMADINSKTTITIVPDDPRWALPIDAKEVANMGWEQNEGWK